MRRFDLDALADERLETARGAMERVAFGHLRTKHGAPRPDEEACVDEERHHVALGDGLAVEALHREALGAARLDVLDECGERRAQPRIVALAQGNERPPAALDVEDRLAAEEDDVRTSHARRSRAGPLRPGQRCAVRLRRVGRGDHECRLVGVRLP